MTPPPRPEKAVLIQFAIDILELNLASTEAGEKTLAELEIDSLQIIQLTMDLEDRFDLKINMESISADMTLVSMLDQTIHLES